MNNTSFKTFIQTIVDATKPNGRNNKKSRLIKAGMGSLIVNVANKALILISGIIIVRILGKEAFGVYSYVLSLILVLIVPIEYGIANLIVRETAVGVITNRPEQIKGVWCWSLRITIITSAVLLVVLLVASYFVMGNLTKVEIQTFYWALGLIPLQSFVFLLSAALRGMDFVVLGQLPDLIIIPGFYTLVMLLFGYFLPIEFSSATAMALRTAITFITFILCTILYIAKVPKTIIQADYIKNGKEWITSAIPLSLSSGLNMVKTRIAILIIGFFVAASEVGTFQVAVSAASIAGLVLQAANMILAPQFASLYANNEKQKLQKLLTSSARVISLFSLIATLIFVFWGKFLLKFAFGPDLIDAYIPALILLIGQLINSLVGSVAFLLNMTGHEKEVMKIIAISTVLNIILTLITSPLLGIVGAAAANTVTLIIAQFAMNSVSRKKLGLEAHIYGQRR